MFTMMNRCLAAAQIASSVMKIMFCVSQTVHLVLERGHPPADGTHAPLTPQITANRAANGRDQTKDKVQPPEAREKPEYSFVTKGETTMWMTKVTP